MRMRPCAGPGSDIHIDGQSTWASDAAQSKKTKGEVAGDGVSVEREEGATRPLGLMNKDAKVAKASVAHGLPEHVARNARLGATCLRD